jgi:phage gp36-like protein
MAYCTEDDLLQMIPPGELAELTADSGEVPDHTVTAEAIAKAGGEIDAYLGVRYALPLAATPPLLKSLAVDLAIYHLYSRRSVAPQVRRQKYEAALAFLKQVAAGQAQVEGLDGEPQAKDFSGASRVFGRDDLADW